MSGGVSGAFGFGRTSTNTNFQQERQPLPETEGDRRVREANEALALGQSQDYQALTDATPGTLGAADQGLLDQSTANLSTMLGEGGLSLSPEQRAALDTIFRNEMTAGQDELVRLANTIAAQRGLALSDSPVANPLLREGAALAARLGTARAQGTLQFGQQAFQNNAALQQFQTQLRQQAFANRAGLLQGTPGSFAYQQARDQFRGGLGTTTGQERSVGKTASGQFGADVKFGG